MPFRCELLSAALLVGVQLLSAQSVGPASADSRITTTASESADVGGPPPVPSVRLVHQKHARYPREARHAGVAGPVVLDVLIARNGDVQDILVVSGNALLVPAAFDAVRRWIYETYTLSDETLAVRTEVTVNFGLDGRVGAVEGPRTLQKVEYEGFPAEVAAAEKYTGEVVRVGRDGVTAPQAIHTPDAEHSAGNHKPDIKGPIVLSLIVTPDGRTSDIKVTRGLREDLDSRAIAAVRRWRFFPSTKNGKPVAVLISVQFDF